MKKIVIVLVLAGAAFLAYRRFGGGAYGISSDHPLGRLDLLDAALVQMKLEKQPTQDVTVEGSDVTSRATLYVDAENSKLTGINEGVMVLVDEAGVVRGIEGRFRFYGDNANPFEYTAVPRFIIGFWKEVGGGSAKFEDEQKGRGVFARRYEIATFDNGVLEGKWIREAPFERIQIVTKE